MMSDKETIEGYVKGDLPLPATFSTGYKRDLEIARKMVRARKGMKPEFSAANQPTDSSAEALQLQYS